MTSAIAKTGINWAEYYRLRNRARWSLPAFLAAAYVLPIPLGIGLRNLRPAFQEVVFFLVIGLAAFICFRPLFKWAAWMCPRCQKRFAEQNRDAYIVLRRLVVDSSCANCKLRCGAAVI
jgi:hypothetical protein